MAKASDINYTNFEDVSSRLDAIVTNVKDKETSLEASLDLFDEAIALGSKAVELVDSIEFSDEEKLRLADISEQEALKDATDSGNETTSIEDPQKDSSVSETVSESPETPQKD